MGGESDRASTDFRMWASVAASRGKESWRTRAVFASMMLRPGDAVCDLGAGAQTLRETLPAGVAYHPVDCVQVFPRTHLADFNDPGFTLPDANFNVIVALGLLNYIGDLERFFERLSVIASGKYFIFTYDFWPMRSKKLSVHARNGIGSYDKGTQMFSRYVSALTPVNVTRRRAMFTGVLDAAATPGIVRQSATKLMCRNIRPHEYVAMKVFGLPMLPPWLA